MKKEYRHLIIEIAIGGLIGLFLLHPLSMLITKGWDEFLMCYEDKMHLFNSPMALYFTLIGLTLASITAFSRIQINRKNEELKRMLTELNQLNATKNKFFSIIAHDLKNPFHTIINFSGAIISNYHKYDTDKILGYIDVIKSSSTNASNLLENLLVWAQSQTGAIEFRPQNVNLNKLINDNIGIVQLQAIKKDIRITFDESSEVISYCDENMVNTILRNLLTNAVKFTDINGEVHINVKNIQEIIEISIKDNGIGIEPSKIENLFKVGGTRSLGTNKEKGSGLGLILCKEFIEKHKGKIWCESKVGDGSVFKFTLEKNTYIEKKE